MKNRETPRIQNCTLDLTGEMCYIYITEKDLSDVVFPDECGGFSVVVRFTERASEFFGKSCEK